MKSLKKKKTNMEKIPAPIHAHSKVNTSSIEYKESLEPQLDFCSKVVSDLTIKHIDILASDIETDKKKEIALNRAIEILHDAAKRHIDKARLKK